ncbi:MAG: sigma-54-dependent Fis family transcriptional regulator [Betaproteobacteria bacterium]|nr:sigma-54-dependent Fis family transcriptional regulator [Betaproteobacteria bacterium]
MENTGEFSLDFDRDFHRVRSGFARKIGTAGINDPDFLAENIARIESIKVQLLTSVVLAEAQKGAILRELEILRNSLLQFSSANGIWDAKPGLERAPQPVSAGLPGGMKIDGILGQGEKIQELVRLISRVAPTNLTVLLEGETGSGKELFARIIHLSSARGKFVAVNCAAFPAGIIESELFGHVKGAYTGAVSERKGKFEEANGGTIFLDEIGELELASQAMLLRVLESGELQRVGSDRAERVDVRVIAATNRDLEKMVKNGRFREDLFYRLNVCQLWVPPLRQRRDEIKILMEFFLQQACAESGRKLPAFGTQLSDFLYDQYEFPGNIRELKNIAHYIAQTAGEETLTLENLPARYRQEIAVPEPSGSESAIPGRKLTRLRGVAEKRYLLSALEKYHGNVHEVCAEFQLSRSRLYQLMKKYGIAQVDFRGAPR